MSRPTPQEIVDEIRATVPDDVLAALEEYPNAIEHNFGFAKRDGRITDEVSIRVHVTDKIPESDLSPEDILPEEIDGYPVDVIDDDPQPDVLGDHRRDYHRPISGGSRFEAEDSPAGCTLGFAQVEIGGLVGPMTNHHCVAEEHVLEPTPVGSEVYQPGAEHEDGLFGVVDATLPREDSPGGLLLEDASHIDPDDIDDLRSSSFALGPMGEPEDAALGEIYVTNGQTTGYRGARCIEVPGGGRHNRFERSDRGSWAGNSGSAWGRIDSEGVFHPVALHHSSNSSSDPDESIATSWAALEDEWGEMTIPDDPGQPTPVDTGDGPIHEVAVYAAEIDGTDCHLDIVAANTAGEADTEATVEVRCESWDESADDDGEVMGEFTVENDSFESSYYEFTIPRVNAYRRVVLDTQWSGGSYEGDIHVEDSPDTYFGFARAEFDAEEYHPGGTVGVEYRVKNPGLIGDDADVDLLIDETIVDTINTGTLSQGSFDDGTLEWPVTESELGTHDVEVQTPDETIDLGTVEVQPLTITATVHDGGTPIQDADVYIVDTTDPEAFSVVDVYQTDVNGEIDEDFDSGEYHALVDEDGHNALSRGFIDVSTHVEFALEDYTPPDSDNVNFDFELIPEDITAAIEAHDTDAATVAGVREREAEITAADVDRASVAGVRTRDASIEAIDVDAAAIEGDRTREAEVSAVDVDSATVAGVTEGRIEGALSAHDTDSASVAGDRSRDAEITAHDVDAASVSGAQVGIINGALSASDVDSASVAGVRTREATISAIDVDAAVVSGVVAGLISGNVESHDTDSASVAGVRTRDASIASIDVDASAVAGVTTNLITAELSAHDTDAASVAGVRTREATISAIDVDEASVAGMQTGIIHGAVAAHDTDSASVAGVRTREGAIESHDTDAAAIESAFIPHLDRLHPAALPWREDNPATLSTDGGNEETLEVE